ncbi:c-type cytochrome [Parasphingorhabdus sp.]|uniref:c-type cytochrome n=1 Tax=Parasphingorhabdus sp. TaxID=2709688 RepID=UPI003A8D4F0E
MRLLIGAGGLAALLCLTACGADPAPGPVEQIIVREPGAAPEATASNDRTGRETADRLVAEGKAAFAGCSGCHSLQKGAASGVGPNLFGIVGQAAGAAKDFGYSDALKRSGIIWDSAELDSFIANPAAKIPGTTMVAGAISEPEKRQAVIAYIIDISRN